MNLEKIENPLGFRKFLLDGYREVIVVFGMPQLLSEHEIEFYCPYQIIGLSDDRIKCAIGMDALQAVEYTMQHIGLRLYTSAEAKAGRLSWDYARRKGDLGFPVTPGETDLLP